MLRAYYTAPPLPPSRQRVEIGLNLKQLGLGDLLQGWVKWAR